MSVVLKRADGENEVYAACCESFVVPERHTAYVRGSWCGTEKAFLRLISTAFCFPAYFGENYNALDECINDLEWLSFGSLELIIDDFDMMFENEADPDGCRKDLIMILEGIQREWNERGIEFVIKVFR